MMSLSTNGKNIVRLPNLKEMAAINGDAFDFVEEQAENSAEDMINSAQMQAESIIKKAELEAQQIINDAKLQAEKIKQQQYELGIAMGREEIDGQMEQMTAQRKEHFKKQAEGLSLRMEDMFEQIQKNLREAICYIAGQVIYKEFREDDEYINKMIKANVQAIKDRTDVKIIVGTTDYQRLDLENYKARGIKIEVDDDFNIGDMKIVCDCQEINFGIGTQVSKIESAVRG